MGIEKTSPARYELRYHFAWSTRYRKKKFKDNHTKEHTKRLFRETAAHYDIEIEKVELLSDCIHFLATVPLRTAPSAIAQILKSTNTRCLFEKYLWLREEYWGGEIWAGGYFARSAGNGLTKERIARYIKEQSEEI